MSDAQHPPVPPRPAAPPWWRRLPGLGRGRPAAPVVALYQAIVAEARRPALYRDCGVPDTAEGRFEMLALHAALVIRRLQAEGAPGRVHAQALFDLMFADMDVNLRELGIGDLSVGKQVKRLARQFYARLQAVDVAFAAGDPAALEPALRANVYHGGAYAAGAVPSAAQIAALVAHLAAREAQLAAADGAGLLRGEWPAAPAAPISS